MGRALLDSARFLGWQIAVKRLKDPNSERKYRRAFSKHLCEWWKPDEAAVDVGVALLRLGLFDPSSFDQRVQRSARKSSNLIPTFDKSALAEKKKAEAASVRKVSSHFTGLEDDDV